MKLLTGSFLLMLLTSCVHSNALPEVPPCPTTSLPAWKNPGQMVTTEVTAYQDAKSKCEATNGCLVTFTKIEGSFVSQCVPRKM